MIDRAVINSLKLIQPSYKQKTKKTAGVKKPHKFISFQPEKIPVTRKQVSELTLQTIFIFKAFQIVRAFSFSRNKFIQE